MMRRRRLLGLFGVLAFVGLAATDASAFSVSYDQKTTEGRKTYESRVQMKDQLFRMDMSMGGQESFILKNADGTFNVMPSEGMAMKMPQLHPGQGPVRGAGNYAQYLQEQNAQKIGEETIDGKACDIYQYTDSESGELTKVWVWKQRTFPIKFESGKMVTELTNIQLGAAIPDSTFQLPEGVQVMDMGGFMGMMGR